MSTEFSFKKARQVVLSFDFCDTMNLNNVSSFLILLTESFFEFDILFQTTMISISNKLIMFSFLNTYG